MTSLLITVLVALPFLAITAVLGWLVLVYPASLRRRADSDPPPPADPTTGSLRMSVVIPTYQESGVIGARLSNILDQRTPIHEVVVIDSASSDGTAEAAQAWSSAHPELPIRVLRLPERLGKAHALEAVRPSLTGDLVVLTDASTSWPPNTLPRVPLAFAESKVGAVSGVYQPAGAGEAAAREASLWARKVRLSLLESRADSTSYLMGELLAVRRELFPKLPADTIADDVAIALAVRRQGYRSIIVPDLAVSEPVLATPGERWRQKLRRAAGGVRESWRARDMVGRSRYGLFGRQIMVARLLTVPFLPWLVLGWGASGLALALLLVGLRDVAFALLAIVLAGGATLALSRTLRREVAAGVWGLFVVAAAGLWVLSGRATPTWRKPERGADPASLPAPGSPP